MSVRYSHSAVSVLTRVVVGEAVIMNVEVTRLVRPVAGGAAIGGPESHVRGVDWRHLRGRTSRLALPAIGNVALVSAPDVG